MESFSALLALCVGNSTVPVNFPHKGQWRGALMFSLIYAWINDWVNNYEAGDLRRHRGHYDVIVMRWIRKSFFIPFTSLVWCWFSGCSVLLSLLLECIVGVFRLWIGFRDFSFCSKIPKCDRVTVIHHDENDDWVQTFACKRCHTLINFSFICNVLVSD